MQATSGGDEGLKTLRMVFWGRCSFCHFNEQVDALLARMDELMQLAFALERCATQNSVSQTT